MVLLCFKEGPVNADTTLESMMSRSALSLAFESLCLKFPVSPVKYISLEA